jgi:hypothetical protein
MPAGTPVQVRLPDEDLAAVDSYRRKQLNPPTRGQALRQLARDALRYSHGEGEDSAASMPVTHN